jgi:excisionase family DNA binding protein
VAAHLRAKIESGETKSNPIKSSSIHLTKASFHAMMRASPEVRSFDGSRVMTDRWLSVEEIAEYLGVSKNTVYAWINKRNMPAHRIGRLWKFKSEEIDEWVRSGGAAESEGRGRE